MLPLWLYRTSLFLDSDLLDVVSDLKYSVHRPSCCWSLAQYYMKHIPSQGRIGLSSLALVPRNGLKTRVLEAENLWLVSEVWCIGCFERNHLKQIFKTVHSYKENRVWPNVLLERCSLLWCSAEQDGCINELVILILISRYWQIMLFNWKKVVFHS